MKVDKTERPPNMHALRGELKKIVKAEGIKVRMASTYNGPESAPSMVTQVEAEAPVFRGPVLPTGEPNPLVGSPAKSPVGHEPAVAPPPPPPPPPPPVQVIVTESASSPDVQGIPLVTRRHLSSHPPPPAAAAEAVPAPPAAAAATDGGTQLSPRLPDPVPAPAPAAEPNQPAAPPARAHQPLSEVVSGTDGPASSVAKIAIIAFGVTVAVLVAILIFFGHVMLPRP